MGCGSSSLKGEKVGDLSGEQMTPARKVQTNFSDVDFSTGRADGRRGTTAVAPHESRPARISEVDTDAPDAPDATNVSEVPDTSTRAQTEMGGAKLEPYKSVGADEPLGETSLPPKKDTTPDIQAGLHASNEEAVSLTTAGESGANPIKASA